MRVRTMMVVTMMVVPGHVRLRFQDTVEGAREDSACLLLALI